jgi:hypothetical protein
MLTTSWWRSTSLRLATGFAVIFALAALVPIGVLWWVTAGNLDSEISTQIRSDADTLRRLYHHGGLAELRSTIASRVATARRDKALYLITDARLTPLAGTLPAWPTAMGHAVGWHDLTLNLEPDAGRTLGREETLGQNSPVRIDHIQLSENLHLLVGRDISELTRLRTLILDAVLWSAVVAVSLAAVLGLLFRRVFLASLRSVRATADAIARGDISRRLPMSGSADEFDLLAGTLNDLFSRIEELVAEVRNVSNAIAHDLRTPLAELRARLEALQRRHTANSPHVATDITADLAEGIDAAILDVDRLNAIFTALLRLADIDSGMRRSAFAPVDLGKVAADVGDLYSALAEAKDITLTTTVTPNLTVWGDRDLLAQAIGNLLDNAIKFTPANGTITLSATPSPPTIAGDTTAGLRVTDSGPGMSDADRVKATQRFFRGDRSRHTPGVGLGLSLVQAVATLHHARLTLSNQQPGLSVLLEWPKESTLKAPDPSDKKAV